MGKEGTPECPRLEWGVSYEVRMGERVRLKARAALGDRDEWRPSDFKLPGAVCKLMQCPLCPEEPPTFSGFFFFYTRE